MKRLIVIGAVAASMLTATGAVAYAAGSGSAGGQDPQGPHRAQVTHRPAAAIDTAVESKFTAIAPCRAVDTRTSGGAFSNGKTRNYNLGSSCSVPSAATAVSATITTVASKSGYLKAWAAGAAQPATSFMNYGTAFNASTGGVIPVRNASISVFNHAGPTQVIIDITGYYIAPLRAFVQANGSLGSGQSSRVVSSTLESDNSYQIIFDRDVSKCTYSVTAYESSYFTVAEELDGNHNGVFVDLKAPGSSSFVTDAFYLTVTC